MEKLNYAIIFFLCTSNLRAQTSLERIKIAEQEGTYPIYNKDNNSLLYHAKKFSADGLYLGSDNIAMNLSDSSKVIINRNDLYPALGWLTSTQVVVYSTHLDPATPEKRKTVTELYIFDLQSKTKTMLDSISVIKNIKGKLIVDYPFIVYQSGVFKSSRIFKYDVATREKFEFKELIYRDINDLAFCYRAIDDLLIFSEDVGGKSRKHFMINFFFRSQVDTLIEGTEDFECLTFDEYSNRFYYITRREIGWNGMFTEGIDELYSFDLTKKEKKLIYTFDRRVSCRKITPYKENQLILELLMPSEKLNILQNPEKNKIGIGTMLTNQLFLLKW